MIFLVYYSEEYLDCNAHVPTILLMHAFKGLDMGAVLKLLIHRNPPKKDQNLH